jgi:hypothetical protein
MAIFQLIYVSSLVNRDPKIVTGILEASLRNNKKNDITGMMLYVDGDIIQALEGEKNAVMDTFSRIMVDMRHVGIIVLDEVENCQRDFGTWSMGYRQLNKADIRESGFSAEFFETRENEITRRIRPGNALDIFRSFAPSAASGQ